MIIISPKIANWKLTYSKYISSGCLLHVANLNKTGSAFALKVPINPKIIFGLNKSLYNSEQNGTKIFVFGQNRNFL